LELLKELLRKGYVYTEKNGTSLCFLQKVFPVIKRSQFKNRSIYYLEDKNKQALKEMMKQDTSRIISYQELSRMSQVFNTDISIHEKNRFLGKNLVRRDYKIKSKKQHHESFSKERQTLLDEFLGRFLHSEVLYVTFINTSAGYADIEIEFTIENSDKLVDTIEEISLKFPGSFRKYTYFTAKKGYKLRCLPEMTEADFKKK